MFNNPVLQRFDIKSPYSMGTFRGLTYRERINIRINRGLICETLIDGISQSGKSTKGEMLCKEYDPNYTLVQTVEDIIRYVENLKRLYKQGKYNRVFNRWILWDEPEAEVPKQQFWDDRNIIADQMVSTWGFLKQHLVLCLPDTSKIRITPNILMKISVVVKGRKPNLKRTGYVRLPFFNQKTQKWGWTLNPVEQFNIEEYKFSESYEKRKVDFFFNNLVPRWKLQMRKEQPNYVELENREKLKNLKKNLNLLKVEYSKARGDKQSGALEKMTKIKNKILDITG